MAVVRGQRWVDDPEVGPSFLGGGDQKSRFRSNAGDACCSVQADAGATPPVPTPASAEVEAVVRALLGDSPSGQV